MGLQPPRFFLLALYGAQFPPSGFNLPIVQVSLKPQIWFPLGKPVSQSRASRTRRKVSLSIYFLESPSKGLGQLFLAERAWSHTGLSHQIPEWRLPALAHPLSLTKAADVAKYPR